MSSTRLSVLTALGATVLVAGCGGSKTLTRSQLVAKAEPICSRIDAKLSAALSAKSPHEISRMAAEFVAYNKQATAELAKLTPPSSMANDWQTIVGSYQAAGGAIAKLGQDFSTKGKPNPADVGTFTKAQQNRRVTASRNDLSSCAQ